MSDISGLKTCIRILPFCLEPQGEETDPGHGDLITLILCRICILGCCFSVFQDRDFQQKTVALKVRDELLDDAYHGWPRMQTVTDCFILFIGSLERGSLVASDDLLSIVGNLGKIETKSTMAVLGEEAGSLVHQKDAASHFNEPIWREYFSVYEAPINGSFSSAVLDHLFAFFRTETFPWSFWREWYQGFLDGTPLDWELQGRVALIDDAIWEAGPEAVAEEIERIRAAYEVERRAAELEASAQTALQTTRGMGDNNPPSPIEDALATSDGVTIIWAAAQELKEEAQSETPDKTRVQKAISAIVGVLKACGIWAAKKVDKGLNAAVIAAGTASGTVGVAWITQNSDKLIELVKAAEAWLPFIP